MTTSNAVEDFKLCNICFLHETDNDTTRFTTNEWKSPIHAQSKYFDNSSWIVIADLLSRGEAIPQEMSLRATTFQLMQQWAGHLEIDIVESPKTGRRRNSSDHFTIQIMWSTTFFWPNGISGNRYTQLFFLPKCWSVSRFNSEPSRGRARYLFHCRATSTFPTARHRNTVLRLQVHQIDHCSSLKLCRSTGQMRLSGG